MGVGPMENHDATGPGTEASGNLATLVSYRGRDRVREILAVDDATLDGLLDGSADWPPDAWERCQQALETLRTLGYVLDPDEAEPADAGEPEGGDDADSAGEPDADGLDQENGDRNGVPEAVHDVEEVEGGDRRDQGAGSWRFWRARDLAITRFCRRGVPQHQQLAALGVLIELEVGLITLFREAPTQPGAQWDGDRQNQEIRRREKLQREVRGELNAMRSVFRRLGHALAGRGRIDTDELLRKLLADAAKAGPGYRPIPVDPLMPFSPDLHKLVRGYLGWHFPQSERRRR